MAIPFAFRSLSGDPSSTFSDPLTIADFTKGAGRFDGIEQPGRRHAVGTSSITADRPAVFIPVALAAGQQVKLDVDFAGGNFRLYVLDATGEVVAENDNSGVTDSGSPGLLDPALTFLPPSSGMVVIVVTSFDNDYLGNWQFANDGTATGSFQLDISAPAPPPTTVLGDEDDLFGGSGTTVYFLKAGGGADRVFMFGTGNSVIKGEAGDDILSGGEGHEVLIGGSGSDTLEAGGGNDLLIGGADMDFLFGMAGDDEIHGGGGEDTLNGGDGNDLIVASAGDGVNAGAGDDRIVGDAVYVDAGAGDDTIVGGDGANTILTGDGNNTVFGGGGNDRIYLGLGNDQVDGGGGNDWVFFVPDGPAVTINLSEPAATGRVAIGMQGSSTGQGQDELAGINRLSATNNDDHITGDDSANTIYGMAGRDELIGRGAADRLYGEDGNDVLEGGFGDDLLFGNNNDDILYGHSDDDKLYGGLGNDFLNGGSGFDELTGGEGADSFEFFSGASAGLPGRKSDRIKDFNQSESDKIDLRLVKAAAEIDTLSFIGTESFSGSSEGGEVRFWFDNGGNTRIDGDTDGDGLADFQIRLTGEINLVATDFLL